MHFDKNDVIYMITNTANNRRYIGRSRNPQKRWKSHLAQMRHGTHSVEDMNLDYQLYGETSFRFSVVCKCSMNLDMECEMMKSFATYDRVHGYNYKDRRANMLSRQELKKKKPRKSDLVLDYEKLQFLMNEKGIKKADVSRGTGIHASLFTDWSKKKFDPSLKNMVIIANYFRVPVEYFIKED